MEEQSTNRVYQTNQIEEGFSMDQELALRSLLFSLVFYILMTPNITRFLEKYLPKSVEVLAVQALLFGLLYYLISNWI